MFNYAGVIAMSSSPALLNNNNSDAETTGDSDAGSRSDDASDDQSVVHVPTIASGTLLIYECSRGCDVCGEPVAFNPLRRLFPDMSFRDSDYGCFHAKWFLCPLCPTADFCEACVQSHEHHDQCYLGRTHAENSICYLCGPQHGVVYDDIEGQDSVEDTDDDHSSQQQGGSED